MSSRRVVDKLIGTTALVSSLAATGALAWSLAALLGGPDLARRLVGLAGLLATPLAVIAAGYVGVQLLRHPPERRSTAAEIRRDAAKLGSTLSHRWEGR